MEFLKLAKIIADYELCLNYMKETGLIKGHSTCVTCSNTMSPAKIAIN